MPQANIQPLGDTAVLARPLGLSDSDARRAVVHWAHVCHQHALPGITDLVPAFGVLGVFFDPSQCSGGAATSALRVIAEWLQDQLQAAPVTELRQTQTHTLPVCYGGPYGPDLEEVAKRAGLSVEQVIGRHASAEYEVGAVGFTPGFGYLEGLPEVLHTPRRASPRVAAPAGSVGIGGRFTGVYPTRSPGGWNLIGQTPRRMFSLGDRPPALLGVGDRVCFRAITPEEFDVLQSGEPNRPATHSHDPLDDVLRVDSPGAQTTLQDLGRPGWRALGVATAGAMDSASLRLANLLAGADENAVALEASLTGPVLECLRDVEIGVAGALPEVLGRPRRLRVCRGESIDLRALTGGRAYLSIAGGFAAHCVLGSGSVDLVAGWGGLQGRALSAGDRLQAACEHRSTGPTRPHVPNWTVANHFAGAPQRGVTELRCLMGPQRDAVGRQGRAKFLASEFRVGRLSSRMGLRLEGPIFSTVAEEWIDSQPVVTGAVQVPPSGQPIVLGADCQTLGGYPVIACVISADWRRLGQLRPGDAVMFTEVTLDEAEQLRRKLEAELRHMAAGIVAHQGLDLTP